MSAHGARPFRERFPRLHEFNARVHRQFADELPRASLHRWMAQYFADWKSAKSQERERRKRREDYFLENVFRPGNEQLLDGTVEVKRHHWTWFDIGADALRDRYPNGLPFHLLNGAYYVRKDDPANSNCYLRGRWPERCYDRTSLPMKSVGLYAWAPSELADGVADWRLQPQAPLPPKQLGRLYTIPEICWGLAALHDADGSYEPFVQTNHALDSWEWSIAKHALNSRSDRLVNDTWRTSLEPLLDRLIVELDVELDVPNDLVTWRDIATLAQVKPSTIQNRISESRTAGEPVPEPVIAAIGHAPAKFSYAAMRPILLKKFPKRAACFPDSFAVVQAKLG